MHLLMLRVHFRGDKGAAGILWHGQPLMRAKACCSLPRPAAPGQPHCAPKLICARCSRAWRHGMRGAHAGCARDFLPRRLCHRAFRCINKPPLFHDASFKNWLLTWWWDIEMLLYTSCCRDGWAESIHTAHNFTITDAAPRRLKPSPLTYFLPFVLVSRQTYHHTAKTWCWYFDL